MQYFRVENLNDRFTVFSLVPIQFCLVLALVSGVAKLITNVTRKQKKRIQGNPNIKVQGGGLTCQISKHTTSPL